MSLIRWFYTILVKNWTHKSTVVIQILVYKHLYNNYHTSYMQKYGLVTSFIRCAKERKNMDLTFLDRQHLITQRFRPITTKRTQQIPHDFRLHVLPSRVYNELALINLSINFKS